MSVQRTTRFSGFDWASELRDIMLIGCGGINSWVALCLSRIGHNLVLIDGDVVDQTNVHGGQMFQTKHIGEKKVECVHQICRDFGCVNEIISIPEMYKEEMGASKIMITGLDNMKSRKECFEAWWPQSANGGLFIDGRMAGELIEIYALDGGNLEHLRKYREEALFTDEQAQELDCTVKATTHIAMGMAERITSTLCNWLTNKKLGMELREVPFYQRAYSPIFEQKKIEIYEEAIAFV